MQRCKPFLWAIAFVLPASTSADDWPQWLGPNRDSVWREAGIVDKFPDDGLKVNWRVPVELGYSGPAVKGNRVFLMDYVKTSGKVTNNPGGPDKLEGRERILCFSATTGETLWEHAYDRPYAVSYGSGPRATPTVDGENVFALGAEGNLTCLKTSNGDVVWSKDLKTEYKVATPIWGFCAHPLVVGDLIYVLVGGTNQVAVALDKNTGKEVWKALSNKLPGYCPPTLIEHGGKSQLIIWHPESINSLNPATGESYWSIPLKPSYSMSITAPRLSGDQLFASGIGSAGALLKLNPDKPSAEVVWRGKPKNAVYCCNSTPFIQDGVIYGNDCQVGNLMAVDLKDGERLWESFKPTTGGSRRASHGTVYVVKHEDRFFLFSETGDLILAKLSPKAYEEISRFHVLEPTNECFGRKVVWSHPAFAQRSVFARNDKELVRVDLSASK